MERFSMILTVLCCADAVDGGGGGGLYRDSLVPLSCGVGCTVTGNSAVYGDDFATGMYRTLGCLHMLCMTVLTRSVWFHNRLCRAGFHHVIAVRIANHQHGDTSNSP